eukprot:UN34685
MLPRSPNLKKQNSVGKNSPRGRNVENTRLHLKLSNCSERCQQLEEENEMLKQQLQTANNHGSTEEMTELIETLKMEVADKDEQLQKERDGATNLQNELLKRAENGLETMRD